MPIFYLMTMNYIFLAKLDAPGDDLKMDFPLAGRFNLFVKHHHHQDEVG